MYMEDASISKESLINNHTMIINAKNRSLVSFSKKSPFLHKKIMKIHKKK